MSERGLLLLVAVVSFFVSYCFVAASFVLLVFEPSQKTNKPQHQDEHIAWHAKALNPDEKRRTRSKQGVHH
jgi:hypothetical protein